MIPGHKGNGAQKRCVQLQKSSQHHQLDLPFYTVPFSSQRSKNFFSFVVVDADFQDGVADSRCFWRVNSHQLRAEFVCLRLALKTNDIRK